MPGAGQVEGRHPVCARTGRRVSRHRVADTHETLAALKEKNSHVRVVVAADSLERLSQAQLALTALHFKNQSVSQLLLTRGRTLGSYTMMLAGETVFLLCAGK